MNSFDVSGSVTLRDVSRPRSDETPTQRLYRLAQKAVIEGLECFVEHGSGRVMVTSSRTRALVYAVDTRTGRCACEGFARHEACKHLGLALAALGDLPDPEPPATAPCPACRGERGFKRQCGGRLSDWIWQECDRCAGTGEIAA